MSVLCNRYSGLYMIHALLLRMYVINEHLNFIRG